MTNMKKIRKVTVRKTLMKELQALKKMEAAFVKTRQVICDNSLSLTGDTFDQISQIYAQLDIAITVVDASVQDRAHKMMQTFVK